MTRSSYETGDGLSSQVAKLVVRQPPSLPKIFQGEALVSASNISVVAGRVETLRCESRGGNPAPRLTWFINNKEVGSVQRNQSEFGNLKRWTVVSTLQYRFDRADHQKAVRCSLSHEALTRKVREESVVLDIQYPPSVKLGQLVVLIIGL